MCDLILVTQRDLVQVSVLTMEVERHRETSSFGEGGGGDFPLKERFMSNNPSGWLCCLPKAKLSF